MMISRSVLFRMINFFRQSCIKNRNTHFTFSKFFLFFFSKILKFMWRNAVEPGMSQMKIMAHAHYMLDV